MIVPQPVLTLIRLAACVLMFGLYATSIPPVQAATPTVAVLPDSAPQNSTITLYLDHFVSGESVEIWQTRPDLSVINIGHRRVNQDGKLELPITLTTSDPPGNYAFRAHSQHSQQTAATDFTLLPAPSQPPTRTTALTVQPSKPRQGQRLHISGTGYNGGEAMRIWLTRPDDSVVEVDAIRSHPDGGFDYYFFTSTDYMTGTYKVTAYGKESDIYGIGTFTMLPANRLPNATSDTVLTVTPARISQGDPIHIQGYGFGSDERVQVSLTRPNGDVEWLFEIRASRRGGGFVKDMRLERLTVGQHFITAVNIANGAQAIAEFEVIPGDVGTN